MKSWLRPRKYLLEMLKWHLQDSRFQRCLGGGGAYYFLSAIHFKTYWELIRKVNFWQCQTLNSFCFRGLCPLKDPTGLCPCTPLGASAPPDSSLVWGPSAPIAIYFQNITVYFKSYWQPWLLAIRWNKQLLNLPPYCSWCWTCLNKHCAATSTAMSSEVTALGNSSTFAKGDVEEVSLKIPSWVLFISSVSLSLILDNTCTAALVWLKCKASLWKSLLLL